MSSELPKTSEPAAQLQCPICKSRSFLAFNGRANARCAQCLSMERTRLLWMVLDRFGLFRMGLRILHMAPEIALVKRFVDLNGDRYHACDVDPKRYKSNYTTVRPIDLCADLIKLPSRSFDLIIHNHVLEHVRCDVEDVLKEMERILAPGGHHFFCVPMRGEVTREDLSDNLMPAHRALLFGQEDHYRIFGSQSLTEMLARVWGPDEEPLIQPRDLFSAEELTLAAIPAEAWSGFSGHSIFHHRRPVYDRFMKPAAVQVGTKNPLAASPKEKAGVGEEWAAGKYDSQPQLILHIGMPKTGTSSIQRWLASCRAELLNCGLDYWSGAENHSELMFLGFASEQRIARGEMWFQRPIFKAIEKLPPSPKEAFYSFLEGLGGRTGIVSAESLWTFTREEIRALGDELRTLGVETHILCWIRRPADYFTSAVQQRCQTNLALSDLGLGLERNIPMSYARLDGWFEVFGKERVTVRKYSEDAVADMRKAFAEMGARLPEGLSPSIALNSSISLLAAKALLAMNDWERRQFGAANGPRRSTLLQTALLKAPGGPFALPRNVAARMQPALAREEAYLSTRLGLKADASATAIETVDDHEFLFWNAEEVGRLLVAINEILLAQEAQDDDQLLP